MDLDRFTAKAKTIMKQGNNWYVVLQTILLAHFSNFLYLKINSNRKIMKKQNLRKHSILRIFVECFLCKQIYFMFPPSVLTVIVEIKIGM